MLQREGYLMSPEAVKARRFYQKQLDVCEEYEAACRAYAEVQEEHHQLASVGIRICGFFHREWTKEQSKPSMHACCAHCNACSEK